MRGLTLSWTIVEVPIGLETPVLELGVNISAVLHLLLGVPVLLVWRSFLYLDLVHSSTIGSPFKLIISEI